VREQEYPVICEDWFGFVKKLAREAFFFHMTKNNNADNNEEKGVKSNGKMAVVASHSVTTSCKTCGDGQTTTRDRCHSHGLSTMSVMTKERANSHS
jgi:hypothetical protein